MGLYKHDYALMNKTKIIVQELNNQNHFGLHIVEENGEWKLDKINLQI